MAIGWFGVPGSKRSGTMTHVFNGGRLLCGRVLAEEQSFQYCGPNDSSVKVECPRCFARLTAQHLKLHRERGTMFANRIRKKRSLMIPSCRHKKFGVHGRCSDCLKKDLLELEGYRAERRLR